MSGEADSPLPSSSDAAQVRQGSLRSSGAVSPANFHRYSTSPLFLCSNWCIFLLASVHCMSMTENGHRLQPRICGKSWGVLSLLEEQMLQITRKKGLRLTTD